MTIAQQALEALGVSRDTAVHRLSRAGKTARRRGTELASNVSSITMWLAVAGAATAGATLMLLTRRGARGRRVKDVMVEDVLTIDASATILDAARKMKEANIGVLPVLDNGKLRGILTDRDIVVRAVAQGADPAIMRVGDCATKELACASPDWHVDEAMRVMSAHQVGRLPVVDDRDRVIGIVTLSSLALRTPEQGEALETAQQVSRRSARIA